jgi:hypothetical protein
VTCSSAGPGGKASISQSAHPIGSCPTRPLAVPAARNARHAHTRAPDREPTTARTDLVERISDRSTQGHSRIAPTLPTRAPRSHANRRAVPARAKRALPSPDRFGRTGRSCMIGRVCCSSAMIGAAVDSTLEAGAASFTMELNSSPGGITMRYRGVCDFTHQRLAAHVDVEPTARSRTPLDSSSSSPISDYQRSSSRRTPGPPYPFTSTSSRSCVSRRTATISSADCHYSCASNVIVGPVPARIAGFRKT